MKQSHRNKCVFILGYTIPIILRSSVVHADLSVTGVVGADYSAIDYGDANFANGGYKSITGVFSAPPIAISSSDSSLGMGDPFGGTSASSMSLGAYNLAHDATSIQMSGSIGGSYQASGDDTPSVLGGSVSGVMTFTVATPQFFALSANAFYPSFDQANQNPTGVTFLDITPGSGSTIAAMPYTTGVLSANLLTGGELFPGHTYQLICDVGTN